MAKPAPVTDATFADAINSDIPVLVDFWAPWCGPCRMIAPILDQVADEYDGKLTILKMNVDENLETGRKFGIRGIPALLLFKEGKKVETVVGYMPKRRLMNKIEPHLSLN